MFKLSDIFIELLLEAKTFNCLKAGEIRYAIDNRFIVEFSYWTKDNKNLAPGKRRVEIYAYGATKEKNGKKNELQPCIRGFQLEGDTSGGKKGGWKNLIYVTLGFVKYGVVSSEGDKIALLLSYGHRVGVSSRALGSVNKENDVNVVQDDLELICWDIVSTPSTPNAWILNSKSEISNFTESKQKTNNLLESKLDKFLNILK